LRRPTDRDRNIVPIVSAFHSRMVRYFMTDRRIAPSIIRTGGCRRPTGFASLGAPRSSALGSRPLTSDRLPSPQWPDVHHPSLAVPPTTPVTAISGAVDRCHHVAVIECP